MAKGAAQLAKQIRELSRIVRGRRRSEPTAEELVRFDWYADSCPCGLPPGDCAIHPRARLAQRPPEGPWRTWTILAGRGAGKTHAGASWIQDRVDRGVMRLGCLIGATAQDCRDVLVDGPSGVIATAPPWNRPRFLASQRRLEWPNGARAVVLTGEEPDRARGLNIDTLWCDELAAWQRPAQTWRMALLALRAGSDPRALITTTPRNIKILKEIMAEPTSVVTRGRTFDNRHLAKEFLDQITAMFRGSRLGLQELEGELLEVSEGAVYPGFDPARHAIPAAEYNPMYPVILAIDAGVSRHTAAVWLQAIPVDHCRHRINVFADFHCEGLFSEAAAQAIAARNAALPSGGRLDRVYLDPAASARSGVGPAAYLAYETTFGPKITGRWPLHSVADGIDQVSLLIDTGCLILHPRCVKLKDALLNYVRKSRRDEFLDEPADGHPQEDLADALRGGIRARFPEGLRVPPMALQTIRARGTL